MMETKTDEIADGIYRISTFVPEIAPPPVHLQSLPRGRGRPLAFSLRPAGDVPVGVVGSRSDSSG